jgi:hypothetical protein
MYICIYNFSLLNLGMQRGTVTWQGATRLNEDSYRSSIQLLKPTAHHSTKAKPSISPQGKIICYVLNRMGWGTLRHPVCISEVNSKYSHITCKTKRVTFTY